MPPDANGSFVETEAPTTPKMTHPLQQLLAVISDLEREAQAAATTGHISWFGVETVVRSLHTSAMLLSDFGEQLADDPGPIQLPRTM